jgi:hypothetical protein
MNSTAEDAIFIRYSLQESKFIEALQWGLQNDNKRKEAEELAPKATEEEIQYAIQIGPDYPSGKEWLIKLFPARKSEIDSAFSEREAYKYVVSWLSVDFRTYYCYSSKMLA